MGKLIAGARFLGLGLTDNQIAGFQAYYEELVEWNQKFNLTAITEYEQVQIRHFADSLSVLLAEEARQALGRADPRVIDVGSGAGFPGIPLKLVCPRIRLTLLEATGKKVRFIEHLVERLGLHRVTAVHARAEELARQHGTPVTSYSTIAHSAATFDMKEQLADMGKINQVIRSGPVELDSPYGGIFFYGVHIVQPLMYIFGEDIDRVRVSRNEQTGNASLVYKNGLFVTLILKNISHGWETFVETEDGLVELKSRVDESDPAICYTDMVEMFRTGKEPRSHASILNCVRVLEALEKSVESQDWEKTGIPEIQIQTI